MLPLSEEWRGLRRNLLITESRGDRGGNFQGKSTRASVPFCPNGKFVGEAFSRAWMAEHGYAPRLIRFEALGPDCDDMRMVVMNYVTGHTLQTLYPDKLPPDVRNGIESALDVLISGGFVFGDLRKQNVMLEDGLDPIASRIRFIDFDWAGKEEPDLRYPFHISSFVRDVSGASEYVQISREHQNRMLESL